MVMEARSPDHSTLRQCVKNSISELILPDVAELGGYAFARFLCQCYQKIDILELVSSIADAQCAVKSFLTPTTSWCF